MPDYPNKAPDPAASPSKLGTLNPNIGALIIRIGFGVYYTIIIIRSPQNPILISKAPTYSTP